MITIYFDLDGTLYDLYNIPNWLELLETENENVFAIGDLLYNENNFNNIIFALLEKNVVFGVITWLPKNASENYCAKCEEIKRNWCKNNLPFISHFTAQKYGTPKQNAIDKKTKQIILIDDNKEVCEKWNTAKQRKSYQITNSNNVVDILRKIFDEI